MPRPGSSPPSQPRQTLSERSRRFLAPPGCALLGCALLGCALVACGIDERASLGTFAQAGPPPAGAGPGVSAGAGGGGAGSAASAGQAPLGGAPEPEPFDAGPPPEPEPLDAGPVAGPCGAPRTYVGDFACTLRLDPNNPFRPPPGGIDTPTMTTSIAFGLEPNADGTAAVLTDGDFMFLAWEVAFMGRLEGQLDCGSGRFDAVIVEGRTGAVFGMPSTFVGALQGMLLDDAGGLSGTWWHGPTDDPMGACRGPWFATPR